MHDTAFRIAGKFFQLYWKPGNQLIVELGACSINGSLRDHQPPGSKYIGLDIEAGPSVDVVIDNSLNLPFADAEADCVISSSTFEHDKFFWQTFLELCRITKPGGFIYLNSPSNGEFHRYPSDYWRFYPDAGRGLEEWATKSGIKVTLVESFVAARLGDQWNDFVAIFQRGAAEPRQDDNFLYNHFDCQNVHRVDFDQIALFEPRTQDMQLLAEARTSAEQALNLKEQLAQLHRQISDLQEVAVQIEPLQQAHILLQNQNEMNSRLLAARTETLAISHTATAQALADRDYEQGRVEKLNTTIQQLLTQLHSVQQNALGVTQEVAARERESTGQMQAAWGQLATREREFAEMFAAKERESTAQMQTIREQLATRELDFVEKFAAHERELTLRLQAMQQQSATRERELTDQLSAKDRKLVEQLQAMRDQFTTREGDFIEKLAGRERDFNVRFHELQRELFNEAQNAATRERESAVRFNSTQDALASQLTVLHSEVARLSNELASNDTTLKSMTKAALADADEIRGLKERAATLVSLAAVGETNRLGLDGVIVERNAQLVQLGRQLAERDLRISQMADEFLRIHGAMSWRLTAFLRKIESWFGARNAHAQIAIQGSRSVSLCPAALIDTPHLADDPPSGGSSEPSAPTGRLDQTIALAASNVADLMGEHAYLFVERAYRTFLKRSSDSQGFKYYVERLLNGSPKIQILIELSESVEARSVGVKLPGLPAAIQRYQLSRTPFVGAIVRLFVNVESDTLNENRLRAIEQQLFANRRLVDERLVQLEPRLRDLERKLPANREPSISSRFERANAKAAAMVDSEIESSVPPIDARSIDLHSSDHPVVSVIIPIYGKINYTLHCLASIATNTPKTPFEIIIVDDCSPDNSVDVLFNINGIRLLRSENNLGFIRSCNIGANAAKGDFLYFLNNDTNVTCGWLDELLRTFHDFPGTGLAGSKLIYPDGRLQEAGGIIWRDGSAWNFGRLQDPSLPIFNYAREVDYCSGASIMVPKVLFNQLGGFDEHYLPAYCEDSDLALKLRDKGYRIIYQPMSVVVHFEGVTSGTDTSRDTKACQIGNSAKLYNRWKERLKAHQPSGVDVDSAKDRCATRRALVLDHCTLTPNQDAGSVTVFNFLLLLREMNFQVTFLPEDNFLYMPEYTTALQRVGVEVLYGPYVTSVEQHLKECGDRYDLAFLFRPGVIERHVRIIRDLCPRAKILYHTIDLHFLRMSREASLQSDKSKQTLADAMKHRELNGIRESNASIVHSTAELELLQSELPEAKLHVFPLILDIRGTTKSFRERKDVVFVGGYQHLPNVDAVLYFVAAIMPLLRKRLPGVRFYAVGSKPPPELLALASDDVIIAGFVEDINSLLDRMRVSVAPLRYGAGIKGKIGSAMAIGLPVVATSIAAEGMSLSNGENILVADGAEQFSDAVARIYKSESLWNHISQTGLEFADRVWGAEAAWTVLSEILRVLGMITVRGLRPLTLYSPPSPTQSSIQAESKSSGGLAEKGWRQHFGT